MKYFIDAAGAIYAYEDDGSQDDLIGDKTPLTEAEADVILNPPPTHEELIAAAEVEKARLIEAAAIAIAPLQDAFELDMATDAENASLLAWKKYRVLLMRVDTAKPVWPTPPGKQAS